MFPIYEGVALGLTLEAAFEKHCFNTVKTAGLQ